MREFLLILLVAAGVTFLLTGVVRHLAVSMGAMAEVRDRDVHAIPTPRLGGLAMFGGLSAALLVASQLPFMRHLFEDSTAPQAVLSGCALVCLLGIIDDRWGLDALTKLAGQTLAAGVMALQGVQILWLPIPGIKTLSLGATESLVLSVLIVVITINAVNFVDGLDGLAAGMVGIAAAAFFGYSYILSVVYAFDRAAASTLITAILTGLCLGFLPHNFNPARIFMGDSGSMLIGLMLAASTISLTGQVDSQIIDDTTNRLPALLPLLLPFAVLALPFADLLLAVIRRTAAGRSPFAADKQHLHHRLLEIGHSQRRAVMIMYFWSGLIAFGTVIASILDGTPTVLAFGALMVVAGLLLIRVPRALPPPRHRRARRAPWPARAVTHGRTQPADRAAGRPGHALAEPVAGAAPRQADRVTGQRG